MNKLRDRIVRAAEGVTSEIVFQYLSSNWISSQCVFCH